MQFKKIVPYKIKRLIPMLGLAGATLAAPSCEKEPIPTRDEFLVFDQYNFLTVEQIQQAAAPSDVHTVYLVPRFLWNNFSANTISVFANKLQEWIDASPKARGQGDFNFALGEASKVPEDSLRIVRNGWTINAYRQDPWQH
ncbi:MAG: hypothetical protein IAC77_02285 [Proteobacteria bacterium]|uniref:Uncharacterized protein n=1 Tax=Candidatus Enterousia excrementavium TaxID=2840789 RepID=A0A940IC81_9PROT|nr:hypothetical protein [Candidatus Enterousia excrementavium]